MNEDFKVVVVVILQQPTLWRWWYSN